MTIFGSVSLFQKLMVFQLSGMLMQQNTRLQLIIISLHLVIQYNTADQNHRHKQEKYRILTPFDYKEKTDCIKLSLLSLFFYF